MRVLLELERTPVILIDCYKMIRVAISNMLMDIIENLHRFQYVKWIFITSMKSKSIKAYYTTALFNYQI